MMADYARGSGGGGSPDTPSTPGAQTPPTLTSGSNSASGSILSSVWTGLVRRFTETDESLYGGSQLDGASGGMAAADSSQHHLSPNPKDGINGVFNPMRRTASPFRPPPLDPVVLKGYRDDDDGTTGTPESARLLSHAVAEEVRAMVPERLRIAEDWRLIYGLEQDGASLATLYQKCRPFQGKRVGFVLVVKDQDGGTFGAYISDYPHPAPTYFGNGECFLWRASTLASLPPPPSADTTNLTRNTTLAPPSSKRHSHSPSSGPSPSPSPSSERGSSTSSPAPSETIRFKAFPYSGLNDYYIHCETGFLSVGSGGGHYGLWLDDSLDVGRSSTCETFGNEPLSDEGAKFGILGVEVWVIGADAPSQRF